MVSTDIELELGDEEATLAFGQRLARATFSDTDAQPQSASSGVETLGAVIYLQGDLGAGKTTLTRGFLRGYGFQGAVKSPTYTLVEPYEMECCHIYHFDLYRLGDPREVEYLGTEAYFQASNVCLIEWPERGEHEIPAPDIHITLSGQGQGRRINCRAGSDKGELICERLCS